MSLVTDMIGQKCGSNDTFCTMSVETTNT